MKDQAFQQEIEGLIQDFRYGRADDRVIDFLEELASFRTVALQSVIAERTRQDTKWGQQNHDPVFWLGILGEEYGELCQAINETVFDNGPEERQKGGYANMRAEAVQVAAVAVAFVEMLDRRYGDAGKA